MDQEDLELLRKAVASLMPRMKEVLKLYLKGHNPQEIGLILGTKTSTVRSQLATVRTALGLKSREDIRIAMTEGLGLDVEDPAGWGRVNEIRRRRAVDPE